MATLRMTHKVAHTAVPEELAAKMPPNLRHCRLQDAHKLDTKPHTLNKNKRTRDSFRNCVYIFNTLPNRLTAITDPKRFSRWLKVFTKDPAKLPIVIPTKDEPKQPPNQTRGSRRGHQKMPNPQPSQTPSSHSSQNRRNSPTISRAQPRPNPTGQIPTDGINGLAPNISQPQWGINRIGGKTNILNPAAQIFIPT